MPRRDARNSRVAEFGSPLQAGYMDIRLVFEYLPCHPAREPPGSESRWFRGESGGNGVCAAGFAGVLFDAHGLCLSSLRGKTWGFEVPTGTETNVGELLGGVACGCFLSHPLTCDGSKNRCHRERTEGPGRRRGKRCARPQVISLRR